MKKARQPLLFPMMYPPNLGAMNPNSSRNYLRTTTHHLPCLRATDHLPCLRATDTEHPNLRPLLDENVSNVGQANDEVRVWNQLLNQGACYSRFSVSCMGLLLYKACLCFYENNFILLRSGPCITVWVCK